MSAAGALVQGAVVPRWRLLPVQGERPERLALRAAQHLRDPAERLPLWGQPRYSSCAFLPRANHVFVAASEHPVGTALALLHDCAIPDLAWCNPADSLLLRRGYAAAMLRLVKLAAQQAIGGKPQRLSSIAITPLPHLRGELLLRTSSGWTGRGRAWNQDAYLLALVWQN